ncbi:MAG: ABC transporter permease [bacterium]
MILLALARFLYRTPWSTGMAFLGVMLGVTSIAGVHLISASIASQLDALIPSQLAVYSHFLHREDLSAQQYFALRQQWREGQLPNVEELAPLIDETTVIEGSEVRVIGVDLLSGLGMGVLAEAGEAGREITGDLTSNADLWRGVWVDSSIQSLQSVPINGVINAPPGTAIADIGVAQDLLGWSAEQLSYVGVVYRSNWQDMVDIGEHILPGFAAGFPLQQTAHTPPGWTALSLSAQHPASSFGKSVLFNISALGLLALLVAWFLIYQVAVSWLRRLWQVFERLYVLGVQWRYLQVTFVAMLLLLGLLAAIAGLFAGRALAILLYQLVLPSQVPDMPLDAWVIGKALVSALSVCGLGGGWAFRQARTTQTVGVVRLFLPAVLTAAVVAGVLADNTGLAGGFLSIAAVSLLAAWVVTPLLKWLARRSPGLPGPLLVRLSLREAIWYPRDMGVALAGLILAVATAIGVSLMVDSFRSDFERMLGQRLSYDLVVAGPAQDLQALQQVLLDLPEVRRVQSYRQDQLRVAGVPMHIVASRTDTLEMSRYDYARALAADEILISEQAARALDLGAGDVLPLGKVDFKVVKVFSSFGDVTPRLIVSQQAVLDVAGAGSVDALPLVSLSVDADNPAKLLNQLQAASDALDFQLQNEIRSLALDTFDRTFAITTALVLIALLVASIGIYIAVTALRLNRKAQMSVLSALGVTRLEVSGMDFALGFGIGAVAMLVAVPLGITLGWLLCDVINPRAFGWTVHLQLTASALLTPVMWGLLAASAAGLIRVGRQEQTMPRESQ